MSRQIVIEQSDRLILGLGVTIAELDRLREGAAKGASLLFDSDALKSLDRPPTAVLLIAGTDDEHLVAQFAPFLPPARTRDEAGEERTGP